MNSNKLFAIQQCEGESLQDYVARFNAATLQVQNLNKVVAMSTLKKGLRNSYHTLPRQEFLSSYVNLLSQVRKYAQAEEATSMRRQTSEASNSGKKCLREEMKGGWNRGQPP